MNGYYVSRQHYYYSGDLAVEIAAGGPDCAGPDMLARHYGFEGFYRDPREAAKAALHLLDEWRRRDPRADIQIAYGHNLDLVEPQTADSREDLLAWAEDEYQRLPKCDWCGGIIGDDIWRAAMFAEDAQYCSAQCCERAMAEYYTDLEADDEEAG